MERVLLTAEEVADALHIGRCTVYDLIRTGQLQSFKIGKLRRIPVDAVHDYTRRMLDDSDSDDVA
jgi:excisionase family DNA binding protein